MKRATLKNSLRRAIARERAINLYRIRLLCSAARRRELGIAGQVRFRSSLADWRAASIQYGVAIMPGEHVRGPKSAAAFPSPRARIFSELVAALIFRCLDPERSEAVKILMRAAVALGLLTKDLRPRPRLSTYLFTAFATSRELFRELLRSELKKPAAPLLPLRRRDVSEAELRDRLQVGARRRTPARERLHGLLGRMIRDFNEDGALERAGYDLDARLGEFLDELLAAEKRGVGRSGPSKRFRRSGNYVRELYRSVIRDYVDVIALERAGYDLDAELGKLLDELFAVKKKQKGSAP
jgi:hypothetical protein